jgi:hypothetical protein
VKAAVYRISSQFIAITVDDKLTVLLVNTFNVELPMIFTIGNDVFVDKTVISVSSASHLFHVLHNSMVATYFSPTTKYWLGIMIGLSIPCWILWWRKFCRLDVLEWNIIAVATTPTVFQPYPPSPNEFVRSKIHALQAPIEEGDLMITFACSGKVGEKLGVVVEEGSCDACVNGLFVRVFITGALVGAIEDWRNSDGEGNADEYRNVGWKVKDEGERDGEDVGWREGIANGCWEGWEVDCLLGSVVGCTEGWLLGHNVGAVLGWLLGCEDGWAVG